MTRAFSQKGFPTLPRLKSSRRTARTDTHACSQVSATLQPKSRFPYYDRTRDLPRLIQAWPNELNSDNRATLEFIVRKLHSALRAERQRGLAGHWTYNVARHSQLLVAYRSELRDLKAKRAPDGPVLQEPNFNDGITN